jgi:Zn-dependent M28 family amino/carboxypeptidase
VPPRSASRATPELVEALRRHVQVLAVSIGPRCHTQVESRARAAEYIRAELAAAGLAAELQRFGPPERGFANVAVEPRGGPDAARLVVGAHYDTVCETPGADDNASGVAVLIELARRSGGAEPGRFTRFIAYTNEERPHFRTDERGSRVAARASRARSEGLDGMIAVEMVGYYSDARGSQSAPSTLPIRRDRGDFLAFVANPSSADFMRAARARFQAAAALPTSEVVAASTLVSDVARSDHASYWEVAYPAFMVTDTANFRNPNYHEPGDTPDTLDFERMAEVVIGLEAVLAGGSP